MLLDGSPDVVGDVLKRKKNAPQAIWARGASFFFVSLKVIRIVRQP